MVDFGETIGVSYYEDGRLFGATKYGKIHYGKNGATAISSLQTADQIFQYLQRYLILL
ncbi:MAG: hypothetical protein GY830_02750 [Bacteroidetes bacterium]|nr:hypothetical protein [Bacteroidota bacterium]